MQSLGLFSVGEAVIFFCLNRQPQCVGGEYVGLIEGTAMVCCGPKVGWLMESQNVVNAAWVLTLVRLKRARGYGYGVVRQIGFRYDVVGGIRL